MTAFYELHQSETAPNSNGTNPYSLDQRKDGFLVRMLAMEHFTMHRISMAMQDYSYVTFKEVEQQILNANVVTDGIVIVQPATQGADSQ